MLAAYTLKTQGRHKNTSKEASDRLKLFPRTLPNLSQLVPAFQSSFFFFFSREKVCASSGVEEVWTEWEKKNLKQLHAQQGADAGLNLPTL